MSDTDTDNRTLKDLARNALEVQSAVNLSGVVYSFAKDIARLRDLLRIDPQFGTQMVNRHPICVMWCSKLSDLSGAEEYSTMRIAIDWCKQQLGE